MLANLQNVLNKSPAQFLLHIVFRLFPVNTPSDLVLPMISNISFAHMKPVSKT